MTRLHLQERTPPNLRGKIGLWRILDSGIVVPVTFRPNQIQDAWGYAAAMALGYGGTAYTIRYMYIEYENVTSPEDAVAIPSFGTDEGVDYYELLSESATRDYLRVPMVTEPVLGIASGYEDLFAHGGGNKLTFFAQCAGSAGVHGKAYSNAANSKVFGVGLVAAPDSTDHSRDIVVARNYFEASEQVVKDVSSHVGVTWELEFRGAT